MIPEFFNPLTKELDTKYYPDVKYYHDDKNTQQLHHTCELFNNGCLTYDKLIERLSKACLDTKTALHAIVRKYVEDFEGYDYDTVTVRRRFQYEGLTFRIVERDENCMGKADIVMSMTRVLGPNNGSLPMNISRKWTLKRIQEEAIGVLEVLKSMGADIQIECTKDLKT